MVNMKKLSHLALAHFLFGMNMDNKFLIVVMNLPKYLLNVTQKDLIPMKRKIIKIIAQMIKAQSLRHLRWEM